MGRLVKALGARSCAADEAKVLMAMPFFPGERIMNLNLSAYFASGDASAIDQPGECNWYGLTIPWSLVWATNMLDLGDTPSVLGTAPAIDQLFTQWLRDIDEDSGETFGGDVDSDPELSEGEATHEDELLNSGPIGVHKFLSREVIMTPLAAEGNTVIRFGDSFYTSTGPIAGAAMGGLLLLGMVRFASTAETNFNVELDDATSREAMGLLISGDYTKVKAKVEGDTSALGDYLRTVLFGGDNFIEADTLKDPAGKAVIKASVFIESAISRRQ